MLAWQEYKRMKLNGIWKERKKEKEQQRLCSPVSEKIKYQTIHIFVSAVLVTCVTGKEKSKSSTKWQQNSITLIS